MLSEQLKDLEQTLWQTADTLRANSDLKLTEYSTPVLGLIFLKFADNKYSSFEKEIQSEFEKLKVTRRERKIEEIALEKCGFYLAPKARYEDVTGLCKLATLDEVKEQEYSLNPGRYVSVVSVIAKNIAAIADFDISTSSMQCFAQSRGEE